MVVCPTAATLTPIEAAIGSSKPVLTKAAEPMTRLTKEKSSSSGGKDRGFDGGVGIDSRVP